MLELTRVEDENGHHENSINENNNNNNNNNYYYYYYCNNSNNNNNDDDDSNRLRAVPIFPLQFVEPRKDIANTGARKPWQGKTREARKIGTADNILFLKN